jgi:antitoxin (DNA-binding transcriptional repressor) of toxin-antitoxin stability system
MRSVSVSQAKAQLSSLLQAAEAGEKVQITRHGKPIAEVRAIPTMTVDPDDPHGLKWLAERRRNRTPMKQSAVDLIREMREADDH